MPRMRNTATGAVVNVSEEKAERLGNEWAPASAEPKAAPKARKKATPKTAEPRADTGE